jgi:hypothetical protein
VIVVTSYSGRASRGDPRIQTVTVDGLEDMLCVLRELCVEKQSAAISQ